ncbi:dTDP-4-dehydrorhamnose reductase [Dokdonella immobilis]|uniref:dTDP-4-dehydrorhamnose reductase n=1 Tax=Dokdonella immobilis TaxID=578942 RepID=A0A1I4YFI8_9GAMM|nr:dTDP-4-dehydrorhamnose reductase [Dokdonella immobilis]SFN36805.1 dTDP-4-dehydrorhamnose reductase [Dokdonella immobilis]
MNVLLLGASGQVGHALRQPLTELGVLTCATRSGSLEDGEACFAVDLEDGGSLRRALDSVRPQLIVNAAAYTAVDRAEQEADRADRINHRAVGEIGAWAARNEALVVHYSTDYVFAGTDPQPRREYDPTAPLGAYGRSKLAGEIALRDSGARHLILRTAWVYAARGHNFLRTMLRLAGERDELRVVDDQIGAPTPAHWIAQATAAILSRLNAMPATGRDLALGTYHVTATGHCSWCAFAAAILAAARTAGLLEKSPRLVPIASVEYPTPARRPAFSVLDNARLALVFGLQLRSWEEGLREVIGELAATEAPGENQ